MTANRYTGYFNIRPDIRDEVHRLVNEKRKSVGLPEWDFSALVSEQKWKGTPEEAKVTQRLKELNSPDPGRQQRTRELWRKRKEARRSEKGSGTEKG